MSNKAYIKEWRLFKGVTGADLARLIHVDRSQINLLENGKRRLTLDHVNTIADALKITQQELLSPPPGNVFATGAPYARPESRKQLDAQLQASIGGIILQVQPPFKLLAVPSDEMEPTLSKGDYVIVDTNDTQASPGLFVLISEDAHEIRRVQRIGSTLRISCDNARYVGSDIPTSSFKAFGRVRSIIRNL